MPVTKGALLHRLVERLEHLEVRVAELEKPAAGPKKRGASYDQRDRVDRV